MKLIRFNKVVSYFSIKTNYRRFQFVTNMILFLSIFIFFYLINSSLKNFILYACFTSTFCYIHEIIMDYSAERKNLYGESGKMNTYTNDNKFRIFSSFIYFLICYLIILKGIPEFILTNKIDEMVVLKLFCFYYIIRLICLLFEVTHFTFGNSIVNYLVFYESTSDKTSLESKAFIKNNKGVLITTFKIKKGVQLLLIIFMILFVVSVSNTSSFNLFSLINYPPFPSPLWTDGNFDKEFFVFLVFYSLIFFLWLFILVLIFGFLKQIFDQDFDYDE